jgi:hypothetical protein
MIPPLDSPSRGGFNGIVIEKSVNFHRDDPFFALQMVNFSSLHDKGRDTESFHHHRRDTLVNALPMAVISLILAIIVSAPLRTT